MRKSLHHFPDWPSVPGVQKLPGCINVYQRSDGRYDNLNIFLLLGGNNTHLIMQTNELVKSFVNLTLFGKELP